MEDNHGLVRGALVRWIPQDRWGYIVSVEGNRVEVRLDGGDTRLFVTDSGVLTRHHFAIGDPVRGVQSDITGVVMSEVVGPEIPTWQVGFPGGVRNVPEAALRTAQLRDPVERLRNGYVGSADDFDLRCTTLAYRTAHDHNELVSLGRARVELKPHQVSVVHRVTTRYPHRFLLADEVGLGKTIEAAMIFEELEARKQARRVLILVPPGLMRQWQFELRTKFNEVFSVITRATTRHLADNGIDNPWSHYDRVIASHTWASWSEERRNAIASVPWDMVIVDEAHHARKQRQGRTERRTNLYRLIHALTSRPEASRRAVLLLTATPMQLQHHELYSLVEMLDPVLFASEDDFAEHVDDLTGLVRMLSRLEESGLPGPEEDAEGFWDEIRDYLDGFDPDDLEQMTARELVDLLRSRHRLSEVVLRNRRAVVGGFQPRRAYRWEVTLTESERAMHERMEEVFRHGFEVAEATGRQDVGFLMVILQKLAASSSNALAASLKKRRRRLIEGRVTALASEGAVAEKLEDDDVASEVIDSLANDVSFEVDLLDQVLEQASQIGLDSKARVLANHLFELFEEDPEGKVLIFTEFRETQEMLADLLKSSGWGVNLFHGQLKPHEKDSSVDRFRDGSGPQILISTEAGGEGRNFQFCHLMVNYDLPWNPMKIEQRIGRIDRIGQDFPVSVFNFHVEGTIESRILDVLERRIKLFEDAVGGLEPILGEAEADIRKALRQTDEARDQAFEDLGKRLEDQISEARVAADQMRDLMLDTNPFGAEIARLIEGAESPISQGAFERFLANLLRSVNTYIDGPNRKGVWNLHFHDPFVAQHQDLFVEAMRRRVCFDPRLNVDSELVEYLGFGHPIIDAAVDRTLKDKLDGASAFLKVDADGLDASGYQFVYRLKIDADRSEHRVFPVFVTDNGDPDPILGERILEISTSFGSHEAAGGIDQVALGRAAQAATVAAAKALDTWTSEYVEAARERAELDRDRIEARIETRRQAAKDHLEATVLTTEKLRTADKESRKILPVWEANLERAQNEIDRIEDDRILLLRDLERRLSPPGEYELVAAARIEPWLHEEAL